MRPDCYECKNRMGLAESYHSCCINEEAIVTAEPVGIHRGWFNHPYNFDPIWLDSCNGFVFIDEGEKL